MLRVALLQMAASPNEPGASLSKGEAFCRRARSMGADIALFPEMWNIGCKRYTGCPDDWREMGQETPEQRQAREQWQAQAIETDGPFVQHFRRLAEELEMAIALTYLERWPVAPRNTVSVIDRRGEIVLTYAKVHTCDFSLEAACTPGEGFYVASLQTAGGAVDVGAMICYDREFPESTRILMLRGAEIVLIPNAAEMEVNRLSQLRSRSFENMVGVALANYAAPQQNGHSVAFDGMAFDEKGRSREMRIVEAGEEEGVYLAPFDLEALRAYRERETWGNAFRRPHRYGALISTDIQAPFRRTNAIGQVYDSSKR